MASKGLFRQVRILILLYLLLMVAVGTWLTAARTTDWNDTLWVTVYPVNGDGSSAATTYIETLDDGSFAPVDAFFREQGERYGIPVERPLRVSRGPTLTELPPAPPVSRNPLKVAWWSLKIRYWAYTVGRTHDRWPADIRVFVAFYDPRTHDTVAHSLGLRKGMLGVVHGFASPSMAGSNNVVITHELLHTMGATDKYNPADGQPLHPIGFAEPARSPLFPQTKAEIMGGKIPLSAHRSETPKDLRLAVVGEQTALEINWIQ